jgi:hypothetical protein
MKTYLCPEDLRANMSILSNSLPEKYVSERRCVGGISAAFDRGAEYLWDKGVRDLAEVWEHIGTEGFDNAYFGWDLMDGKQ